MKKKNKLKRHATAQTDKFSLNRHCGGRFALVEGTICEDCAEWSGRRLSADEQGRVFELIGWKGQE